MTLVVDAGPLYAYVDADDRHHDACLELLGTHPGPLVVPQLAIAEVAHLIGVPGGGGLGRERAARRRPRHVDAFTLLPSG